MKTKIDIFVAEEIVRQLAEKENIEDRVYEFVQSLADGYVEQVVNEYDVDDAELDSGSEWYDEVHEEIYEKIFNELAKFFQSR